MDANKGTRLWIALGNDKLRCVYGSQTYGTFQIQLTFSDAGDNATDIICAPVLHESIVGDAVTVGPTGVVLFPKNEY